MIELAISLKENFQKSALYDLTSWFLTLPDNAAWYVISDYCFGDKTKKNDTATFSILLNHDKVENIKDYINRFTPNDIKSSRKVAPEFLQYINSPVIFNISFLIDRDTKLGSVPLVVEIKKAYPLGIQLTACDRAKTKEGHAYE